MAFSYLKQAMGALAGISRQGSACACCERQVNIINLFSISLRDWLVMTNWPVRLFLGFVMKAQKQAAVLILITLALLQVNTEIGRAHV